MAIKGQKFKQWTAEEKYEIIKPYLKMKKSIELVDTLKKIHKLCIFFI